MQGFARLPLRDRRVYRDQAAALLGLPAVSIEKDFWVCWTLRALFGLAGWGPHLTFKGGTSLSKGWQLIERFSEDLDLVIDREVLGFGASGGPEQAPTGKQREKRLVALKAACQQSVQQQLRPVLTDAMANGLSTLNTWTLEAASRDEDPDEQTLLFFYPTAFAGSLGYIRPVAKIELGARSDTEPSESPLIKPYVAAALPGLFMDATFPVRAVAPRRTFWEKALLLHEETFRPTEKPRRRQLARHYYDLWSLIRKGVAGDALADPDLFTRVAAHRQVFFRYGWMDYTTFRPGTLRLVPLEQQRAAWLQDYAAMRPEMFFGEVPTFDEILRVVGDFERQFNALATAPAT
jgi:hypothetical protein